MYDRDTGRMWLVRDRVGVLPLYYYVDEHQLVFASEIKAILEVLGNLARPDEASSRTSRRAPCMHLPVCSAAFASSARSRRGGVRPRRGDRDALLDVAVPKILSSARIRRP